MDVIDLGEHSLSAKRYCYSGLILAGGRGRRIQGADKGLFPWQGKPLVEYSLLALQPHCDQLYINCNRNQTRYAQYGYPLISDRSDDFPGPLQALAEILPQLPGTHFILLPCDSPGVTAALMEQLLTASQCHPAQWIYATAGGRDHPLHSVLPASLVPELLTLVAQGERRLMHSLKQLPHHTIQFPDDLDLNLNHPDQAPSPTS